jgi:hypothetical protein
LYQNEKLSKCCKKTCTVAEPQLLVKENPFFRESSQCENIHWSPGPRPSPVFRSAVCDCLSLNVSISLQYTLYLSAESREGVAAGVTREGSFPRKYPDLRGKVFRACDGLAASYAFVHARRLRCWLRVLFAQRAVGGFDQNRSKFDPSTLTDRRLDTKVNPAAHPTRPHRSPAPARDVAGRTSPPPPPSY